MFSKEDAKRGQGLAILAMVMLHLFCKKTPLPYDVKIFVGGTPLIYYFGLFGDICVPIYCFISGYAQVLQQRKTLSNNLWIRDNLRRLWRLAINCWIVFALYAVVQILIGSPLTKAEILGNITFLKITCNGAWWFVFTYAVLIMVAPLLWKAMKKHGKLTAAVMILFYVSGYMLHLGKICPDGNAFLNWILYQYGNFGFSVFPFWSGMVFAEHDIFERISAVFHKIKGIKFQNILLLFCMAAMIIGHGIVQTAAVSPVTGICTLIVFNLWMHNCKENGYVSKFFLFMGKHSTNIWLTHMFVMDYLLRDGMYVGRYPIVVLVFVLGICIGISYLIRTIYTVIVKCAYGC